MSTYDLHKQMEAAKVLKAQIADLVAGDPEFLSDAIEGETNLFEQLDALVISVRADEALADGTERLIERLKIRKEAIDKRAETKRSLIGSAMEIAEIRSRETPAGTVTLKKIPPKVIVTEEADIPSSYFKTPDPRLDLKAIGAALKARSKALDDAAAVEVPEEREAARAAAETAFPPIPGATLSNGGTTIQIRG